MKASIYATELPEVEGTSTASRVGRTALLVVVDMGGLLIAGAAAYFSWALPVKDQNPAVYLNLIPLLSLFVAGYAQAGLYPGFGLGPVETLKRISYVTAFGFLVLASISFALKLPPLYSRVTALIALLLSLLLVPLGRVIVTRLAHKWLWWREPVVVIGSGPSTARAVSAIKAGRLGYWPAAVLDLGATIEDRSVDGSTIIGSLTRAGQLAGRGVRVAVVESARLGDRNILDQLQRQFRHVVFLSEYSHLPVDGIQIRNLGGVVGIEYTTNLLGRRNRAVKRATDIAVALLAFVIAAPIMLLAAVLVWSFDGRPIFFIQGRGGMHGRRVSVPKLRTMTRDAEQRLEEFLYRRPELRADWNSRFKLPNDPRLIPIIGRMFRRWSIDELPQLWSVLVGDMSLVGPRPFPKYHLSQLSPIARELRERVRPGITGLWQVTSRSDGGIDQQEAYDSYYIRNWSMWLDIYILARTLIAVVTGRGAY